MPRSSKEILSTLSDFELLELVYMSNSEIATIASILVSFYFGYLVVAYFAGSKLTSSQALLLTLMYSLIVGVSLFGLSLEVAANVRVRSILITTEPVYLPVYITTGVHLFAWLLTLVYMFQVRRSDA